MNQQLSALVVIIVAYLLGSIPFGYLIVRATAGVDVRETGSGGTGATNVSRRAGKLAGVITLLLDALKGTGAVLFSQRYLGLTNINYLVAAAAIAVIVGHVFPVWLGFRGGKGVATGVGVFLVLAPLAVVCAAFVFIILVWSTRYVSLGSIIAAVTIPLLVWIQHSVVRPSNDLRALMLSAIVGASLIVLAHRGNIYRLVTGTESRFK